MTIVQVEMNTIITFLGMLCATVQGVTGSYASLIRKKIGIASIDRVATNYQEAMQYPSLNILGLRSGWVGEQTRTIVPASAVAEMDIRLVRESDPDRLIRLLMEHILEQGFHFVHDSPTEEERLKYAKLVRIDSDISYGAFRTDFDTAVGNWLRTAMKKAFGSVPIQIRTAGGSIPISPFVNTLGVPAVIVRDLLEGRRAELRGEAE